MNKIKRINSILLGLLLVVLALVLSYSSFRINVKSMAYDRSVSLAPEHDFEEIVNPFDDNVNYISYTEFRANIATASASAQSIESNTIGKGIKIRIDTAAELHNFSVDVSPFEEENYLHAKTLMKLDYVLGNDINYLEVTGNRFIPIGYHYTIDGVVYSSEFSGTFDGQGFEINNLYLADYDELITITEEADIATTPYYAMFSFSSGEIKNFGLIDPHYELRIAHENITKAAHIVGENTGLVENVYVIYNQANTGINMRTVTGQTQAVYEAAGLVYYNKGEGRVYSSYYAGDVVINPQQLINFEVQPAVFKNENMTGVLNIIYDQTRYLLSVTSGGQTFDVTPVDIFIHEGKSSSALKENGFSGTGNWFYYPDYRYPALFGLRENNDYYEINNEIEFIYFNKLLRLNYLNEDDVNYRYANYKLVNDIDLRMLAPKAYVTPSRSFEGKINGNDKTIGYVNIDEGISLNQEYFAGLFSVFSGQLANLTLVETNINLTTAEAPNMNYHIGLFAGTLDQATIDGLYIQGDINLGEKIPAKLAVGLLAGDASGTVKNVYINGDINSHIIYEQNNVTNIDYYIGGIVGETSSLQLNLNNVLHIGDIKSPTSNLTQNFSQNLKIVVGGVIGNVNNTLIKHNFKQVSHVGKIELENILATNSSYFAAGVVGNSEGANYTRSDNNRDWTHRGTIYNKVSDVNLTTKTVYIAGVVNANHSGQNEFLGLYNYDLLIDGVQLGFIDLEKNTNLSYAQLVNSRSSNGIILSQSKNDAAVLFDYTYSYSGVVISSGQSLLRFVENSGDITYDSFTYMSSFNVNGITANGNTDFLNVINSGAIVLKGLTNGLASTSNTYDIQIAGITNTLNNQRYIKNSYNQGNIITANINLQHGNLYIGGLVVRNLSGDLHNQDGQLNPKATAGIINSLNYGNISSTLNESIYALDGTGNTFVGGLVMANNGSVQDSVNHGDITMYNKNESPYVSFNGDSNLGGRIEEYQSGVILGGIAATVGSGNSRVYDTSNGGEIIGLSQAFVRTGGIVAVVLEQELNAGGASFFGTSTIPDSIISNGINYGSIIALTAIIVKYDDGSSRSGTDTLYLGSEAQRTGSISRPTTTTGTGQRPGVHASAGGVIGYGLSEMRRMINHGQIISTDVAGGVVGATFVYSPAAGSSTYVKIDTAINYGSVRAYKADSYNNFDEINFTINNINNDLYDPNDDFIIPTGVSNDVLRRYPRHKRGIGGVFGRLQRGLDRYMVGDGTGGSQFDFIVNMDPNVDLIGRLDQVNNFSSSLRYFKFGNAKYYSAKKDDTTQAAFTGFYYRADRNNLNNNVVLNQVTYTRNRYYEYNDGDSRYRVYQGYGTQVTYTRSNNNYAERKIYYTAGNQVFYENQTTYDRGGSSSTSNTNMWRNLSEPIRVGDANPNLVTTYFPSEYGRENPSTTRAYYVGDDYINPVVNLLFSSLEYLHVKEVPWITETQVANSQAIYVYDPAFEMRNEKTILSNGEAITTYINYAYQNVLGERFTTGGVTPRPNGMYVLASTAGSVYGATLPTNTNLTSVLRLDGKQTHNTDYESLENREELNLDTDQRYLKYKNLFQVKLNDKSELLTQNQEFAIRDRNTGLELVNPTINHTTKQITFNLNMALLPSGQTGLTLDLEVIKALLPYNAFIADLYSSANYPDQQAFMDALKTESLANPSAVASSDYPADLSIKFSEYPTIFNYTNGRYNVSSNQTISVGSFRSYSEAALDLIALMNIYYTDYEVFITFRSGQTTSIRPTSYAIDNQNSVNIATGDNLNPYDISTGINNQIVFNHRDSSNVLVVGHDIKEYIKLYYQDTSIPVDPQYYQVITTKVNSSGNFQSTIILDQKLRSGTYLIEYKYYASDSTKTFQINKAASTAGNILQLHQNYLDPINNPTNNITTEVPLLYPITASDLIISQHTIDGLPAYLDNSYYSIGLLENIVLAPFASLTNVMVTTEYLETGFISYIVTYQITSESGNVTNYVNTINEIPVTLDYRYINGVVTYGTNLEAKREDDLTTFEFAYSVNPLFSHLFYNLDTGLDAYLEVTSPGYPTYNYQTNDNLLTILMDSSVAPGSYDFTISLKRKTGVGENVITLPLGTQTITKLAGSSSYLTNIAFGEEGTELSYPSIDILNNDTNTPILYDENNENPKFNDINNSYESFVYYVGIEYDGADINNQEKHIRIIGEIDNINLNEYAPRLVEFLPIGATIQRLVYTSEGITYTTPVNQNSDPSDIALLETDYTLYPTDGSEPNEDSIQDVIITYLVTSEDGQNKTYYYISVVDATYNINYIFNVFYVGQDNIRRSIHDIETFNNLPIRIQTAIMNTGESFFEVKPSVSQFPSFNNITKFESHISMYYQALNGLENDATKYRFRLARNRAGFYQFTVDLPSEYVYTMFFNNEELNDISNYVSGVEGKYFYINTGIRNRTRTIDIVIKDATGPSGWGLHEDGASYYDK